MDTLDIPTVKEQLAETVKKMADFMSLECQVEVRDETDDKGNKTILVSVHTPDNARFLIGKNGQNLKSIEHVLRAMFVKKIDGGYNISVDVNDYKKSRSDYVVEVARQVVTRVRSTQKAESMPPMSGYERRVVHMELASCPDIATESIGTEPNRRIVVKPYP